MARPRSFDPDETLDLARDVFWQKGFHGTSLDDITAATGIAKPSLYAAFGDKNALFLKVLDRYHARIVANAERIINEGPAARDAVPSQSRSISPNCGARKVDSFSASGSGATTGSASGSRSISGVMLPAAISRSASTVALSLSTGTVASAPLARRRAR